VVLRLSGICKSFGAFRALVDADFTARRGEIHALLGENGAGKSSLMNVAAGFYAPSAGLIEKDGVALAFAGPGDARAHRIGMVHQHFKLVAPFTVAENVLLANPRGAHRAGLKAVAAEILQRAADLGFTIDPDRRVATLSVAEQQRVEILKLMMAGADILILDEPTAVLTDGEAGRLLATLRDLSDAGTAVVLVTHKLHEVVTHADRVTIMRGGRTVATVNPRDSSIAELTRLVVGMDVERPPRAAAAPGPVALRVQRLSSLGRDGRPSLADASFSVRAGEIYGLAGVSGNGQSELAEILMGVRAPAAGSVDRPDPAPLAAVPADRAVYALAGSLSVVENFAIRDVSAGRCGGWGRLDRGAMRAGAEAAVANFDIQGVRSLAQKAALLSGGNAQKLSPARRVGCSRTARAAASTCGPARPFTPAYWPHGKPGPRFFSSATTSTRSCRCPTASAS
jgi:ABC-type uncharacterized transport system ATPase subunit